MDWFYAFPIFMGKVLILTFITALVVGVMFKILMMFYRFLNVFGDKP